MALALPLSAQDTPTTPAPTEPETVTTKPAAEKPKQKSALEEPPLHRWGAMDWTLGAWKADLRGSTYAVGTVFQGTAFSNNAVINAPADPVLRGMVKVVWYLPKSMGQLQFHYDAFRNTTRYSVLDPGNFIYGETQVLPEFAGVANDGRADGLAADALTKTRRFRVEYGHTAFETPRSRGTWHAGLRYIDHSESLDNFYYALVSGIPPLLPPLPSLTGIEPNPDYAHVGADYSGTGVGAGLDVEFAVHPRIKIVGGLSLGVSGGKSKSQYQSISYFYWSTGGPLGEKILTYDELLYALNVNNPDTAKFVVQSTATATVVDTGSFQVVPDIDAYLSVEGRVWSSLRVWAGIRAMAYPGAGIRIRPTSYQLLETVVGGPIQTAVNTVEHTTYSVGYTGFMLGLAYRF
ncbi:MAG TPA: hypothetical protein VMR65_07815 [Candidatus Sulfotelmatobacter sp.]|nr:hypothetical protein [Candidatus Sulfotelmatobacter sp.]